MKRWQFVVPTAIAAVLVGTAVTAVAAPAPGLRGKVVADAFVSERAPHAKQGTEDSLRVSDDPANRKVSFITVVVQGTAGTKPKSVKLVLHRDNHHFSSADASIFRVTAPWNQADITAANAPAVGKKLDTQHVERSGAEVALDVTEAITGPGTYSFAITTNVKDDVLRFRSTEATTDRPRVVVRNAQAPVGSTTTTSTTNAPVTNSATWIGASSGSNINDFVADAATLGPLTYRRSFNSSLPATFQTSNARDDAARGYKSFVSWKPPSGDYAGAAQGRYDDAIIRWAKSVPNTGVYATAFHEPENDMTGPQFVALQRHLYTIVKQANPSIKWGPVYMAYWWDKGTGHYIGDPAAWYPGNDYADFVGVDVYSPKTAKPLVDNNGFMTWFNFANPTGKPLVIAEYGQYVVAPGATRDAAQEAKRPAVIAQDAAWVKKTGRFAMWLYWNNGGAQGDWAMHDAASQNAWKQVALSGRQK